MRHHLYRWLERIQFATKVMLLRRHGVRITYGVDSKFIGTPQLKLLSDTEVKIGSMCVFRSISDSNPIGIDHPLTLCTLASGAKIEIGNQVGISGGSLCARKSIYIGNGTLIGANTYVFDNDFHALDPTARINDDYSSVRAAPVHIGSNVFIGARSIILKGVVIGDNSIIGAGSVVTKSIPSNSIASGNPCTIRSQLASTNE